MLKITLFAIFVLALIFTGCMIKSRNSLPPLETVKFVDLDRYAGEWYEIARYQHRFQKGCVGSKATYSRNEDGGITVINQCYDSSFSGKLRSVRGKARVADTETNAKLKVSFFWPFSGDYWIIDLGENYEYAVVGHPSRKYLWILSRSPTMKDEVYNDILDRLEKMEYDTSKLLRTIHKNGEQP